MINNIKQNIFLISSKSVHFVNESFLFYIFDRFQNFDFGLLEFEFELKIV